MKVHIRMMKKTDLDMVSELSTLANPHAIKERYRPNLVGWLEQFRDLAFVAEEDGSVVGYVIGEVGHDIAWIQDIAVASGQQRKGVGSMLLRRELQALSKRKPKTITVEVHWKNSGAIPFYYKHGFRMSGMSKNRFGLGHDAVFLELDLNGT